MTVSLAALRDGLRDRSWSAAEMAEAAIQRMDRQRRLNAFITETPDRARADARAADAALMAGTAGSLAGIPIAVKDMFCTRGVRTTAGSRILGDFVPPYESTVTARLAAAGGVLVGKANMDEFAMGSTTLTSAFGPTVSPVAGADGVPLVPGGSSGGSAAAVAAGIVPAALGTDTGGSVRQPASLCGIVGLKPTYGRCSRWGIVAYGSSFDQAGVLARDIRDAAILLDAIVGQDAKDTTSVASPEHDFEGSVDAAVAGLTVGVPREFRIAGLPQDVARMWDAAIRTLETAGVTVRDVSLPLSRTALAAYYVLVCAEASSNLARYDGVRYGARTGDGRYDAMVARTRADGFGAEVRRRVLAGTYILSAGQYDRFFGKAQKVRTMLVEEFRGIMTGVDALLFPTSPIPAFPIADGMPEDPVQTYLIDVYTVTANLLGTPAISVPFGVSVTGLPLGMQVMGRWFGEETVLPLAQTLFRDRARP